MGSPGGECPSWTGPQVSVHRWTPLASSSLCSAWSPWRPLTPIYSLDFFFSFCFVFETEGRGYHIFAKPGRDDLIHATTYAIALADGVLLYILQPYHAQLNRKVPVLYRSSLSLYIYISLSVWPGLTLCTNQQQSPAACTWCHLDPAPQQTTSTSPDSSRTTHHRLVKHM